MKLSISACSLALCLSVATVAGAEDIKRWDSAGEWEIFVDPLVGDGCFLQKRFDDGTLLQIGAEPARGGAFVAAFNKAWTDIEDGQQGVVMFEFEGEGFSGETVGWVRDGVPGGYAFFDNLDFVESFAARKSLTITGESGRSVTLDLAGSALAVEAGMACQMEQPQLPD